MPNECVPYYEPGQHITGVTTAAVTGKRFVMLDAASTWHPEGLKGGVAIPPTAPVDPNVMPIKTCASGAKAIGVSQQDAASGKPLTVMRGPGICLPVKATAALNAGDEVQSDATGQAIVAGAGIKLGICIGKTNAGADAPIILY